MTKLTDTSSSSDTVQIVLSTAHPAKFSEAVTRALNDSPTFDFARDVMPEEFKGLLEKEKRVIDVEAPSAELVKNVIEEHVGVNIVSDDRIGGSV